MVEPRTYVQNHYVIKYHHLVILCSKLRNEYEPQWNPWLYLRGPCYCHHTKLPHIVRPGQELTIGQWAHETGLTSSDVHICTMLRMSRAQVHHILKATDWHIGQPKMYHFIPMAKLSTYFFANDCDKVADPWGSHPHVMDFPNFTPPFPVMLDPKYETTWLTHKINMIYCMFILESIHWLSLLDSFRNCFSDSLPIFGAKYHS